MSSSTTEFNTASVSLELSADRSSGFFAMDECKNEFLATLAHEIRNPLAPIKNGLHGGFVIAESDGLNCGSTITVRLPLAKGIQLRSLDSKAVSNHISRSYRVLVVDDMRSLRVVTEQLFVRLGHTVQIAESGKLALEMLDSFQPDIVFSDISMPGMSGHDLARRIRERADLSDVYLVAMTGYGQPSDREMAFGAGFDCHLTKPAALQRLRGLFDELDSVQRENIVR